MVYSGNFEQALLFALSPIDDVNFPPRLAQLPTGNAIHTGRTVMQRYPEDYFLFDTDAHAEE